jgi:ribonuclease HI
MGRHRRQLIAAAGLFLVASLSGGLHAQPLSYVATYEDAGCRSSPTQFTFTADPSCASPASPPACSAVGGSSVYSSQACSTTSEISEILADAFTSKLFLVVKTFSDAGVCSTLTEVATYLADELCHVDADGSTSFKVTMLGGSSGSSATLETFSGMTCSGSAHKSTDFSYARLTTTSCAENVDQLSYMGGATSKWTILSLFADEGCATKPVNLQANHRFICDAERDPANAECAVFYDPTYSTWSCADDYVAFTTDALGAGVPFYVEEWYLDQVTCSEIDHFMIFPADGTCVPMDWMSVRVDLHAGGVAHYTIFSSGNCTGYADTQVFDRVRLGSKACAPDSNIKYRIRGVTPQWRSTAAYEVDDCSATPAQLTFTSEFTCEPRTSEGSAGCVAVDAQASSGSDCSEDYFAFAASAYGETHPYVLVENYAGADECDVLVSVIVYAADGLCHDSLDGLSSFLVTVESDLSATIQTFEGPACGGSESATSVSRSVLESHACFEGDRRFFVGGKTTQWTAVAVHDVSDCATAPVQVAFTKELTCTASSAPTCVQGGSSAVYLSRDCVDGYAEFAEDAFAGNSYMLVESYDRRANCQVLQGIAAYVADAKCHTSIDGVSSFLITLEVGGAATMTLFDDADCQDETPTATTFPQDALGLSACVEGHLKVKVSTALMPTPIPTATNLLDTTRATSYVVFFSGGAVGDAICGGSGTAIVKVTRTDRLHSIEYMAGRVYAGAKAASPMAAHLGLLRGLRECWERKWTPVHVVGDNAVIVRQHVTRTPPKDTCVAAAYWKARKIADALPVASWATQSREFNKTAQALVTLACSKVGMEWKAELDPSEGRKWAMISVHATTDADTWRKAQDEEDYSKSEP